MVHSSLELAMRYYYALLSTSLDASRGVKPEHLLQVGSPVAYLRGTNTSKDMMI